MTRFLAFPVLLLSLLILITSGPSLVTHGKDKPIFSNIPAPAKPDKDVKIDSTPGDMSPLMCKGKVDKQIKKH
ncbi:MAG: hypothetical protein ACJ74G_08080 [Blastocatellia bacterium]